MIKIIAVFDGLKFSETALKHSIDIAKRQKAHLVGLFLEDFTYQSFSKYKALTKDRLSLQQIEELELKDKDLRKASRQKFVQACMADGIEYSIHKEDNIAYPSLLHETIYADLVILDAKETFTPYEEAIPTQFIRDFLAASECPVLLVNKQYMPVTSILLLFDGTPNSVYAIKQFSYLIDTVPDIPIEVLTIKAEKDSMHLPDGKLMKEFLFRHFPKATFTVLKGSLPESEILEYLENVSHSPMIILGAYRRGMVSRWFKQSMADTLMENVSFPLFIAHNKS